jgi:hypothetical protein
MTDEEIDRLGGGPTGTVAAAPIRHPVYAAWRHRGTCHTTGVAELGPAPAAASTSVVQPMGSSTSTSTTGGTSVCSDGCQLAVTGTGLCRARLQRGVG